MPELVAYLIISLSGQSFWLGPWENCAVAMQQAARVEANWIGAAAGYGAGCLNIPAGSAPGAVSAMPPVTIDGSVVTFGNGGGINEQNFD